MIDLLYTYYCHADGLNLYQNLFAVIVINCLSDRNNVVLQFSFTVQTPCSRLPVVSNFS